MLRPLILYVLEILCLILILFPCLILHSFVNDRILLILVIEPLFVFFLILRESALFITSYQFFLLHLVWGGLNRSKGNEIFIFLCASSSVDLLEYRLLSLDNQGWSLCLLLTLLLIIFWV